MFLQGKIKEYVYHYNMYGKTYNDKKNFIDPRKKKN